jgi:hypothetical protein
MDPNSNLEEQLRLAADLVEIGSADAARLAELVLALDEWIRRGGFIPARWNRVTIKVQGVNHG